VLGEEPCLDTAYVLGIAGPTWCSRCGPPEQEGKEGWAEARGGEAVTGERVQEGEERGRTEERREKKLGKMVE
jgi:hypothetical protein